MPSRRWERSGGRSERAARAGEQDMELSAVPGEPDDTAGGRDDEADLTMPIEQPLLDILACPIDKQGLLFFADDSILYNPRLRRIYRLTAGYPVMLADRAEPTSEEDHLRLLKRAAHGEAVGTAGHDPRLIML